jgi:hypothetical protein
LEELERIVLAGEERDEMVQRLEDLETSFNNASIALQDSDSLLQLITKAHSKLNSLIDGTIPVELQYNTDVIFNGLGTVVDKSVPNRIKVNNTVQGYYNNSVFKWDINAGERVGGALGGTNTFNPSGADGGSALFGVWSQLKPFTNRISLIDKTSGNPSSSNLGGEDMPELSGDLNIYIDDGRVAWKEGQTVKISFETINVSDSDIYIRTGSASGFDKIVGSVIRPSDLLSNKPYFEVVCIDPVNYIFEVDILR